MCWGDELTNQRGPITNMNTHTHPSHCMHAHVGIGPCLTINNKGCVTMWPCHLHFKVFFKAKEESWKLEYFTMQKYINLQKKSSKGNQNPSRHYESITTLKFQHKPKYVVFQKSLKLLYSIRTLNTISFALVGKANKIHT